VETVELDLALIRAVKAEIDHAETLVTGVPRDGH
jgi:hypothetical protein